MYTSLLAYAIWRRIHMVGEYINNIYSCVIWGMAWSCFKKHKLLGEKLLKKKLNRAAMVQLHGRGDILIGAKVTFIRTAVKF